MQPIVTDLVVWSVCLSVGRSDTLVSPAKTAEPIDMLFGLLKEPCVHDGPDPPW